MLGIRCAQCLDVFGHDLPLYNICLITNLEHGGAVNTCRSNTLYYIIYKLLADHTLVSPLRCSGLAEHFVQ